MDYNNLPSNNPQMLSVPGKPAEEKPKRERQQAMFEVKEQKKHSKFAQIFIKGTGGDVKDYILKEALPNLGSWLWTNLIRAVECYFSGEPHYGGSMFPGNGYAYTRSQAQYYNYTQPKVGQQKPVATPQSTRFGFDDIEFLDTRKAGECLRKLDDIIGEYGSVTVGDYLDLIGRMPSKTDWNYGWTDLSTVVIRPTGNGAVLIFPEPRPI